MRKQHVSHDSRKMKSKHIIMNQQDVEKIEIRVDKTHKLFYAQQFSTKNVQSARQSDENNYIYSVEKFKKKMFNKEFDF